MKDIFKPSDQKHYRKIVAPEDVASFHGEVVHPVCSTFVLAREIEWTTRLFVLEMREDDEEGVGTFLNIQHCGPAFIGEEIHFIGIIKTIEGNEVVCTYQAKVGERLIAHGSTGQKILKRSKLDQLFKAKG